VEFFVTKAHGKLEFPETKWSVDTVENKSEELLAVAETLKQCSLQLKHAEIIAALLTQAPEPSASPPIGQLFQLGASALEGQTTPWFLGSTPLKPTDAKSPETPQKPQE
jgi:hypothetical protein